MPLHIPRLPLIGSGQTVTTSQPLLDLTQTWNDAGVTFVGFKLNVTATASAAASLLLDLQVGGVSKFSVDKGGTGTLPAGVSLVAGGGDKIVSVGGRIDFSAGSAVRVSLNSGGLILGNMSLQWDAASGGSNGGDLKLFRDAANVLALRNGTAAQVFNVYNTWTDASNYERLSITWASNVLTIGTLAAGSGTARTLAFATGGTTYWSIPTTGALTAATAAAGVTLKQGANGRVGTFVLNGSTPVAVSNTSVAITDSIIISLNTVGGVVGVFPSIVTITAATGFSVAGTAADTSTYNYAIIKNAA